MPLSISATCPVLAGDVTTRATNTEVKIALNATAGGYATTAKTYRVTASSSSITLAPKDADNTWEVTGDLTSTPLTIYGWLDENTPVACSESDIAISNGNISNVTLSPAYACIGVRVVLGRDKEAAGIYTITSSLSGIGTASANNGWDTSGTMPILKAGSSSPAGIKNTDKETVTEIKAGDLITDYFMRVAPTTIPKSTASLFTITLPNGQQLLIASGAEAIKIEGGNCYFFTVNIGSETSITVNGIQTMTITDIFDDNVALFPPGYPRSKGIFTKYDWNSFVIDYSNGKINNWVDQEGFVNLYTDIDLKNKIFTPFNSLNEQLNFNGHGHTISNLSITKSGANETAGFFGYLSGYCTIQGLTIDGVTIDYSYFNGSKLSSIGVIVGEIEGPYVKVIDCHVKGKVTIFGDGGGSRGPGDVGGIVGVVKDNAMVYACTFNPSESSVISGVNMGGIAGTLSRTMIAGCIAHGCNFIWRGDSRDCGAIYATANTADVMGCVAYNITGDRGGELIGSGGRNGGCYGYNVFGKAGIEGGISGSINYLEDLSSAEVISSLNTFLEAAYKRQGLPPFHFEASSIPGTGPTIKPGAAN